MYETPLLLLPGVLKGLTLAMTRAEKSVVAPSHICVLTPTALDYWRLSAWFISIFIFYDAC